MNGARQQQGPGPAYGNGNGMRAPDAGGANGVYAYNQGNGSMSNGGNYGMGVNGGMASQRKMPSSSYNSNAAAQGATGQQGLVTGPAASGSSASGSGSARIGKVRRPRPDTEEIKRVGRIHYQELLGFLKSHLARGQMGPRSNAREKLTRLSKQQFTELSTDVYDELMRRVDNARKGDEMPHLAVREEFHPKRNQARQKLATLPKTRFKDLASDVFFELERRFPELREEFRPDAAEYERASSRGPGAAAGAQSASSEKPRDVITPQPSTADIVVPNKSKLIEEDVRVPYANATSNDGEEPPPGYDPDKDDGDRASIRDSIMTADNENDAFNRNTVYSQASSVGTGFFNGYAGSKATESIVASPHLGRNSDGEGLSSAFGIEKMRSDYEFRIATLQQRVTTLEAEAKKGGSGKEANIMRGELDGAKALHDEQLKSLQKEIEEHRSRHDAKHSELEETLQKLDQLQEEHATLQKEKEARGAAGDDAESLRQELDQLQGEHSRQEELVTELRSEVSSLLEELRLLSSRNDEMLADKDTDQAVIRDLENQVSSYKRKYETAKTELRNMKATSQLYVQPPKADDFMPASEGGAIVDVNLTAFQSSIDELLAAARSKTPSNVLLAMKTVVLATTLVTDDVNKYEARSSIDSGSSSEEKEQLTALRTRASNTLNNLMTACRNHASSHGLSPVSLLDAAASHVATAIVDIVKLLKVRKATKAEAEEFEATFTQNGTLPNGLKPLHTNVFASSSSAKDPPFSPGYDRGRQTPADNRLNPSSSVKGEGRFSPRSRNAPSMGRYSPVGYRPDISRNNSHGEGSWKDSRSRTLSMSSASSAAAANAAGSDSVPATPAVPMPLAASLLRTKSGSSSQQPSEPGDDQQTQRSQQQQEQARDNVKGGAPSNGYTISQSPSWSSNMSEQQAQQSNDSTSPDVQVPLSATLPTSADNSVEENWAELRNYIKVQTEAIVHSIQALLSSIREGAQSHQLTENLTQITTIVSSIVAISSDNLPDDEQSRLEGPKILKDLADNCDRLSEMQTKQEFDKATKSAMAAASFGVAKGLKALTVLFESADELHDLA